jgi:hypothetical protein
MAKYLWVGNTAAAYSPNGNTASWTTANIVDQYNFNKVGNWYGITVGSGGLKWISTQATPGPGDTVIFGGEGFAAIPGLSYAELNGWTAAKSPCLFGGYSGGVTSGSWSNTSGVGIGTTFSTALNIVMGNIEKGYNFPYLGGGITGDIASWCAIRDGVSAGFHQKAYSNGVRDPQANLKLKWKNYNQIWNIRQLQAAPADVTSVNYLNTFIYDFDSVKALTQIGASGSAGATANSGSVQTILNFLGRGGAGLRVRSGSIDVAYINMMNQGGAPADSYNYASYGSYNDCGIELYNTFIKELNVAKWQGTYLKGCTLANATVWPIALGVVQNSNPPRYTDQATFEFASSVDVNATLNDLAAGFTWSSSDYSQYYGVITLVSGVTIRNSSGIGDTVYLAPSQQTSTKHTAIIGDRVDNKTISIPKINIYSGAASGVSGFDATGTFPYMPWAVEFAGPSQVTTIFNYGGYVYSNQDIDPAASVQISELYLRDSAVLDFSKKQSGFDQWLIGGLSASTGQIYGGIIFQDETAKVLGSNNVRLWNTQTKVNNSINTRIPAGPPSTTQPPNTIA